ncbi:Protein of unknown function (DUF3098) [Kordia periserrulae]|uniref:DUF3098 family protein n=1 Tax=Kordia periserrulae TaxID=701523 RepID=A0A2T6BT91_9FLAO|nr:Protein of unknown function (DUF3098) [Kordia periserrulae]
MKNKNSKSNRKKAKSAPQKPVQQPVATQKDDAATVKNNPSNQENISQSNFVFGKKNYLFMFIGLAVIALGFILMAGGGSDDPNVFNEDIFSTRRIHIAPMVVVLGFAIEVYAILLNPNSDA